MESMTIEYKSKLTDDFEGEVAAFLNSLGGKLFISVNDDGNIIGIQNPDKISLAVIDRIKNNIVPATLGLFNVEVKEERGSSYICVTVAEGLEKPYYLKKYGMSVKGCYTRIANTLSNVVSPNQHLAFTQLRIYYAEKGFEASGEYFLRNLGLYTEDDRYNYVA